MQRLTTCPHNLLLGVSMRAGRDLRRGLVEKCMKEDQAAAFLLPRWARVPLPLYKRRMGRILPELYLHDARGVNGP